MSHLSVVINNGQVSEAHAAEELEDLRHGRLGVYRARATVAVLGDVLTRNISIISYIHETCDKGAIG